MTVSADVVVLGAIVVLAGIVKGAAGFGAALVGTSLLAIVAGPVGGVVLFVVPLLASNLSLALDLERENLSSCARTFRPFLTGSFAGAVAGTVLIGRLPAEPFKLLLGAMTIAFVAVRSSRSLAAKAPLSVDAVPARVAGFLAGLVFGLTNVGVQVVSYVKARNVGRGVFVGVLSLLFVVMGSVRVAMLAALGGVGTRLTTSLLLAIPMIAGVALGKRLRSTVAPVWRERLVLLLLAGVGLKLVLVGIHI